MYSQSIQYTLLLCIDTLSPQAFLYMDEGKPKEFGALFTSDGVLQIVVANKVSTGTEELQKVCEWFHATFAPRRHWEGNVIIKPGEPDAEGRRTATNTSYWKSLDGGTIKSTGVHRDTFQCGKDGVWRFSSRIIEHVWSDKG